MGGKRQHRTQGSRKSRNLQKLSVEEVDDLSKQFLSLNTPEELCELLNISIDSLMSVFFSKYSSFKILKNNRERIIKSPNSVLLEVQRNLSYYLNCVYVAQILDKNTSQSYAYVPALQLNSSKNYNINIVTNAANHVHKKLLGCLDIKNFFTSINTLKIEELFKNMPFNFNDDLIRFILQIVTQDNSLPVGAATSPILSNFIMVKLDDQFNKFPNVNYTRYSDDLSFSTNEYSIIEFENIISLISKILETNGFEINETKKSIKKSTQKQVVTGIIVNTKTNIDRKYIRNLRAILHSVNMLGLQLAADKYAEIYKNKYLRAIKKFFLSGNNFELSDDIIFNYVHNGTLWYFEKSLRAKIEHIGYVKGKQDIIYKNLLFQYSTLLKVKFLPEFRPSVDLVYVTNATANSLVFYAYTFLKNYNFTDEEIIELRSKFYFMESNKISYQEVLKNFKNQSAYFLNLYTYMLSIDRFENYITKLDNHDLFHIPFNKNESSLTFKKQFNRKVYHTNPDCKNLRSHYDEVVFHINTGVFFENHNEINKNIYILTRSFLDKLHMRKCKKC